nr:hypothetical protein [Tanacetum cinerariifolium]
MRQNTRKPKPKPNNNPKPIARTFSVRDIIGDRRFDQFRRAITPQTEGIKKAKRVNDAVCEPDDRRNLGGKTSSAQYETTNERQRSLDDFAAKTSEYAFFKSMKDDSCGGNVRVTPNLRDNQMNDVRQSDRFTREETPNVKRDNGCSNVRVTANCHDRRMNDVRQSDQFIRKEIPNVQKESVKYARSSVPIEKERKDPHYSLFSTPCCRPKSTEENNVFGVNATNVQYATPGENNWLLSSVSRKTKASGIKDVFSVKREKLRQRIADKSLYDVRELSTKGFDPVSALISRILPENQENNSQREADSKCKVTSFSDTDQATLIKDRDAYKRKSESQHIAYLDDGGHEAYKRKSVSQQIAYLDDGGHEAYKRKSEYQHIAYLDDGGHEAYKRQSESQHIAYLDDGFSGSAKRPIDMDLPEWHSTGSESPFSNYAPSSSTQYNHCHKKAYKSRLVEPPRISCLDDDFSRSASRLLDMNPADLDSSTQYNHCHTKAYKSRLVESPRISYLDDDFSRSARRLIDMNPADLDSSIQYNHRSTEGGFRHPNFEVKRIVSFDEPLHRYESSNFQELEESPFYNEPKLLEPPHGRPLMLGWEDNSEKDEFQFSTSSTSQDDGYQLFKPNALHSEHASSLPYTPKCLMAVEDCLTNFTSKDYTWSMDKSLNEKEHQSSESSLFLIQSPIYNQRRFPNTALHSFVVNNENEDSLVFGSNQFLEGRKKPYSSSSYMEPYQDIDHIEYPLLLHNSSWNDTL